jgi:hypothetical protein
MTASDAGLEAVARASLDALIAPPPELRGHTPREVLESVSDVWRDDTSAWRLTVYLLPEAERRLADAERRLESAGQHPDGALRALHGRSRYAYFVSLEMYRELRVQLVRHDRAVTSSGRGS